MKPGLQGMFRCALLLLLGALGACSSLRPWQNLPLTNEKRQPLLQEAPAALDQSMLMVVSMSGGGARAAAFGYGVLDELRQTRVQWHGRNIGLLDQLDVISGVSGGSIIAAYYAVFGDQTFPAFEQQFLQQNFQDSLLSTMLNLSSMQDLSSPWFGRSNLLANRLDTLYQGKRFGDLPDRAGKPRLLISATDLSLGSSFEFTWRQFSMICSDLASVPLSFAVAASSAVPIALSPMTLKNHNDRCARPLTDVKNTSVNDYRVRLLRDNQRSYLDAKARPYIHLVDGGLSDNLGLRSLLDRSQADGGLRGSVRQAASASIHKLVIIAVNAERDPTEHIDANDQVPNTFQVVDALLFGTGGRATLETLGLLNDTTQAWRQELSQSAGGNDPFAPDAQIHVINVNLRDAPENLGRRALLQVPTAFSLPLEDVSRLTQAGRHTLRESAQFKALLESMGGRQVPP